MTAWKIPAALEHLTYDEKRELLVTVAAAIGAAVALDRVLTAVTAPMPLDKLMDTVLDVFAGAMDGDES